MAGKSSWSVVANGRHAGTLERMSRRFARLIAVYVTVSPVVAIACSPATLNPSRLEMTIAAREAFRSAAAIIDAEVIETGDSEGQGVTLRAERIWKGPRQQTFRVRALSTCDIGFWERHSRLRIVLSGGPSIYTASQRNNGVLVGDSAAFARELDRLVGNRRPPEFRQPNSEHVR